MSADLGITGLSLLAGAAFAAGVVDAIGGGGGLVTLPALLTAGLARGAALATNKGQSTFGTLAATIAFFRAGSLDRGRAAVTFPLAMIGSFGGASVVLTISNEALKPIVVILLI